MLSILFCWNVGRDYINKTNVTDSNNSRIKGGFGGLQAPPRKYLKISKFLTKVHTNNSL